MVTQVAYRETYRQHAGRHQGAEVTAPESLEREVIGHFLEFISIYSFRPSRFKHTSSENSTPPIGLPKATATPAAADAVRISLVFDALCLYLPKNREITLPVHTAKWTLGPSFPTERPDAMANGKAIDLMSRVHAPRKPFMTKPAMMHLISEMPEPAAYGAKDLTRIAATKARSTWWNVSPV